MNSHQVLIAFLLIGTALGTIIPRVTPIITHQPKTYRINLEDSPEVQWKEVLTDYKVPLDKFLQEFDKLHIPEAFFEGVEWYAKNMFKHQDFVANIDAISKLSGHPFEKMFFLNFVYELTTFKACTTILIRNSAGVIMHGRNFDLEFFNLFANLIANIDFYRAGQKEFTIATVAGSVLPVTGIREGAYSINANTRKAQHFYNDLISVMLEDALPSVWLIRKVFEKETTYANAVKKLQHQQIAGPVYFTVAGVQKNEGMIIERETKGYKAFYELSDINWFLVQTNYDRDLPDPVHDPRRVAVEHRVSERGKAHFQKQELFDDFMFVWPTFNIATISTTIMIPSENYHNVTVMYGHNPTAQTVQQSNH